MTDDDLVTVAQAAAVLDVAQSTVYSWRRRRLIAPKRVLRAGRIRQLYSLAELERAKLEDGRRRDD